MYGSVQVSVHARMCPWT